MLRYGMQQPCSAPKAVIGVAACIDTVNALQNTIKIYFIVPMAIGIPAFVGKIPKMEVNIVVSEKVLFLVASPVSIGA